MSRFDWPMIGVAHASVEDGRLRISPCLPLRALTASLDRAAADVVLERLVVTGAKNPAGTDGGSRPAIGVLSAGHSPVVLWFESAADADLFVREAEASGSTVPTTVRTVPYSQLDRYVGPESAAP
jgi:hypothetical protein